MPQGDDRANYQAAFDLLKDGKYPEAISGFKQFLTTFPNSALADNAQYWLGEAHYVTKQYPDALRAFRTVLEKYPDSRKMPDALLKIGYCNYELKNWPRGPFGARTGRAALRRHDRRAPREPAPGEDGWRGPVGCRRFLCTRDRPCSAPVAVETYANESLRLKLTEIFLSIQGEADSVGWPTVFVRLTGCPLRCQYCDTQYAFYGGEWFALDDVLERVAAFGVAPRVRDRRRAARAEALPRAAAAPVRRRLSRFARDQRRDRRQPGRPAGDSRRRREDAGSGEVARNRLENLDALRADEQVKFVHLRSRRLRMGARPGARAAALHERCTVLFSPSYGQLEARELAQWILDERLPVRFQVQLHKYLWGDTPGR